MKKAELPDIAPWPWVARGFINIREAMGDGPDTNAIVLFSEGDRSQDIAWILGKGTKRGEAHARLLRASPQMFLACMLVLQFFRGELPHTHEVVSGLIKALLDAVEPVLKE